MTRPDESAYFEQFRGDDTTIVDLHEDLKLGAHYLICWLLRQMPDAKVIDTYTHWLTPKTIDIVCKLPNEEYYLILHLTRWDKSKPMVYWSPSVMFFSEYCTQCVSGNDPIPDWAEWLVTASRQ